MLNSFIIAFEAVVPMFILVGIGMLVRRSSLISKEENRKLNKMAFKVFFSALMFNSIYSNGVDKAINYRLMLYGIIAVLIVYVLTTIFVLRVEPSNPTRGSLIQAIYRSNFVLMGLPIVSSISGASELASTALMIAVVIPINNILAILTLEYYGGGKANLKDMLIKLAKNPMLEGAVLGILSLVLGVKLPFFLEKLVSDMAAVATPLTLVILGISFEFSQIKGVRS